MRVKGDCERGQHRPDCGSLAIERYVKPYKGVGSMPLQTNGVALLSRRAWRGAARSVQKRSRALVVSLLVLTSCVTILGFSLFPQSAQAQNSSRVTVAAVAPSLVAG